MDLLHDITHIIKDDLRHNVKLVIDGSGIMIYLDDDPDEEMTEKYVIPIQYDRLYDCCYIPYDEYVKCMHDDADVGVDKEEIALILRLMEYLETDETKQEINNVCDMLSLWSRKEFVEDKE